MISKVSDVLARANPERAQETLSERLDRLSTNEVKRRDEVRKEMTESKWRDLSFKPRINPVSRSIISEQERNEDGSEKVEIHERLYMEAKERATATTLAHIETEEKQRSEFPFKPEIRSKSNRKSIYCRENQRNLLQVMAEEKRKKELLLERKRQEEEGRKSVECTFKPQRGKKVPQDSQPIIVHGLAR